MRHAHPRRLRRVSPWLTLAVLSLGLATLAAAPVWTPQASGVTARTVLRTEDGGATWRRREIPGTGDLDFRDIDAVGVRAAFALSIGPGALSRIYRTDDAGSSWVLQFTNDDPKAFFDAMAFWSADAGVAVSDSVDGRFVLLMTADGGRHWARVPAGGLPAALPGEGAFAASGTNVALRPGGHGWIGTTQGRVLRTTDSGRTWSVATTGLATSPTAGIFSVAFRDAIHGLVVGGDYKEEGVALKNAAVTDDGGATWTPVEGPGHHAFAFAPGGRLAWGVGEAGRISRLRW